MKLNTTASANLEAMNKLETYADMLSDGVYTTSTNGDLCSAGFYSNEYDCSFGDIFSAPRLMDAVNEAISEHELTRTVNGEEVDTLSREFHSANILKAEVGTNSYHGGDTGHGCRTYFRLEDLGGTDLRCRTVQGAYGTESIEISLGGDCELDTFLNALEFAVKVLKFQIAENMDNCIPF